MDPRSDYRTRAFEILKENMDNVRSRLREMEVKKASNNQLVFTSEDVKNARLTCSTSFEDIPWEMEIGFTAESTFYQTNKLSGFSSEWYHDEGVLQVRTRLYPNEKTKTDTLRLDFNYASFVKLNFEVTDISDTQYHVYFTFVVSNTPIILLEKIDRRKDEKTDKTEDFTARCRFYKQPYRAVVKEFWEDLIGASAFRISYNFRKEEFHSFLQQIYSSCTSCPILYNKIPIKLFNVKELQNLDDRTKSWPWNYRYYIESIKSLGTVGRFFLDYQLFTMGEIDTFVLSDGRVANEWASKILISMYFFLQRDISLSSLEFTPQHYEALPLLGHDYVYIKTAYITPTKTVLALEEPTMNNRGFRKLKANNILQVKFRDEDLSRFPRETYILGHVVLIPLIKGIVIAGRTFRNFGASSSLFCEHGTYFYATDKQEEIVRLVKTFGKFKYEAASKVAARLGQYFTSAKEVKEKLRKNQIAYMEDFELKDNQGEVLYTFSDGIGVISPGYAERIKAEFGLHFVPSAFQIRCLGYKGMVSVDPYDRRLVGHPGGTLEVIFRKSQLKFTAPDNGDIDFDVAKWSGPSPVKLHRSLITLLVCLAEDCGKKEQAENRLHELLTKAFVDVTSSLTEPKAFMDVLEKLPKFFAVNKLPPRILFNEPFLRSMVEANAVFVGKLLKTKTQIPIGDNLGRLALGIVDTLGILKPDEIFFQYTKDIYSKSSNPERLIRTGPIGVTKSPMYHLGDLRYYTAANYKELHHLYDVVVFPQYGNRPIPDEIGGGDLDGDEYMVFWDQDFLFTHTEAADYTAASTDHIPRVEVEQLHEKHADFRVDYMLNNNLEQLSNCHLIHMICQHPNHPEVEKVAQKADVAVNYFKSGLEAGKISPDEKHTFNPDFMDKRHEPAFTSEHILCKLYKRCATFYRTVQVAQELAQKRRVQKSQKTINVPVAARETYERYKAEIEKIMKQYNIHSEAELFSNQILEIPGVFNTYKLTKRDDNAVESIMRALVYDTFKRYRTEILNRFAEGWEVDMKNRLESFTSYKIANVTQELKDLARSYYVLAENEGTCLSFPWIAYEGLEDMLLAKYQEVSLETKLSSEVRTCNIRELSAPNENHRRIYNRFYREFDSFRIAVEAWIHKEHITRVSSDQLIHFFVNQLSNSSVYGDRSVTQSFDNAFIDFLRHLASFKFTNLNFRIEETYKAAQSTLIELAFSPDTLILGGISLQRYVLPYPAFVISVRKCYTIQFKARYRELLELSGCTDIAIRARKECRFYTHFTISCRGTIEACQKLESMLTPFVKYNNNISMREMKQRKSDAMEKLLLAIFRFDPPPPYQSNFGHARSTLGLFSNQLEERRQLSADRYHRHDSV